MLIKLPPSGVSIRRPTAGESRLCVLNLEGWIVASVALYLFTVVFMQIRLRDVAAAAAREGQPLPAAYHRLYRVWFAFGFLALTAVLAIFWLMITRPDLGA